MFFAASLAKSYSNQQKMVGITPAKSLQLFWEGYLKKKKNASLFVHRNYGPQRSHFSNTPRFLLLMGFPNRTGWLMSQQSFQKHAIVLLKDKQTLFLENISGIWSSTLAPVKGKVAVSRHTHQWGVLSIWQSSMLQQWSLNCLFVLRPRGMKKARPL